ncbi:MAG TPA: H-type small acid-soluble spore protein [Candidatus Merdicola faecigallinarum]|uniref:H-type small acid-soluble spore protein n=1 Tax=Candidatus Merdicola faecigallinarum TaxID=2840862 RepID=A0A9D1M1S2_9FIRM|nr:H-type small acid-soluble spore protein [Candidatus Merdicola faecigallinarum]
MNLHRAYELLNNKEKVDIFYNERPVWIQELNDNIAKVGFIDNFEEKDVYIEDLYEGNLYH